MSKEKIKPCLHNGAWMRSNDEIPRAWLELYSSGSWFYLWSKTPIHVVSHYEMEKCNCKKLNVVKCPKRK